MYPIMTSCVSVEGTTNLGPVARLEYPKKYFLGMFFRSRQILVRLEMHTPTLEILHT